MSAAQQDSIMWFLVVFASAFLFVIWSAWLEARRRRWFDTLRIVRPEIEYPNNHHVFGVGYYHAASKRWFMYPWNEFREGRGYFWDGAWQKSPDQRLVQKSGPDDAEIDRVNSLWRKADPDLTEKFWKEVERDGFGTAIRRSEGS